MTSRKALYKIYSSFSVELNRLKNILISQSNPAVLHPGEPTPGTLGTQASLLLWVSSHSILFSFCSQGDMGALGPIGYPGPKGMKVNRAAPYSGPHLGTPDPFQPEGRAPRHDVGGGEGVGWKDAQRGAGVEVGRSGAQCFPDLRANYLFVINARPLSWAAVLRLSMNLRWFRPHHQGHRNYSANH